MALTEYAAVVEFTPQQALSIAGKYGQIPARFLLGLVAVGLKALANKGTEKTLGCQVFKSRDGQFHGQQSLKQLSRQGKADMVIDSNDPKYETLNSDALKDVRKMLKKNHVDFTIAKGKDGTIKIFFRGSDAERAKMGIEAAAERYTNRLSAKEARSKGREEAKKRNEERRKEKEQGHEHGREKNRKKSRGGPDL